MPGKPSPVFLLLREIAHGRLKRAWINPRPVYAAAAMTLVAALLMLSAVGGIRQAFHTAPPPVPVSDADRPEAGSPVAPPPAIRPETAEKPPAKAPAPDNAAAPAADQSPCPPVQGEVKLAYGWQLHPVYKDWRYHTGQDFSVPAGSPVRAALAGRVVRIYKDAAFGLAVVVESPPYTVIYASLSRAEAREGQRLAAGTRIGTAGDCPGEPYPHLHLAVKRGEKYIDPAGWLDGAE